MNRKQLMICSLLGILAVVLGALGAHKLQVFLTPVQLNSWETGVQYHFIHNLALLAIALSGRQDKWLSRAFYGFAIGIVLFSGSLYFLALKSYMGIGDIGLLGLLTPLGGVFLIAGWAMLFILALKKNVRNPL